MAHTDPSSHPLPLVSLACHPSDAGEYLPLLQQEIVKVRPCSFLPSESLQALTPLLSVNLIVIPATELLLTTDNFIIREVLPFARRHCIPVCPVITPSVLQSTPEGFHVIQAYEYTFGLPLALMNWYIQDDIPQQLQKMLPFFLRQLFMPDDHSEVSQALTVYSRGQHLLFGSAEELDRSQGLQLIHQALDLSTPGSPLHTKIIQCVLIPVYLLGIGVPRNLQKACDYLELLSKTYRRKRDSAIKALYCQFWICCCQDILGNKEEAAVRGIKLAEACRRHLGTPLSPNFAVYKTDDDMRADACRCRQGTPLSLNFNAYQTAEGMLIIICIKLAEQLIFRNRCSAAIPWLEEARTVSFDLQKLMLKCFDVVEDHAKEEILHLLIPDFDLIWQTLHESVLHVPVLVLQHMGLMLCGDEEHSVLLKSFLVQELEGRRNIAFLYPTHKHMDALSDACRRPQTWRQLRSHIGLACPLDLLEKTILDFRQLYHESGDPYALSCAEAIAKNFVKLKFPFFSVDSSTPLGIAAFVLYQNLLCTPAEPSHDLVFLTLSRALLGRYYAACWDYSAAEYCLQKSIEAWRRIPVGDYTWEEQHRLTFSWNEIVSGLPYLQENSETRATLEEIEKIWMYVHSDSNDWRSLNRCRAVQTAVAEMMSPSDAT